MNEHLQPAVRSLRRGYRNRASNTGSSRPVPLPRGVRLPSAPRDGAPQPNERDAAVTDAATLTLTAEQLVVALQALRDYQDKLEIALRHKRATQEHLRTQQQHAINVTTILSTAYIGLPL